MEETMQQHFLASLLAVSVAASPLTAQTKPAATKPAQTNRSAAPIPGAPVPEVAFEKYELPNGLDVILHVDRKLPVVHVNQWYHVGSKNERVGRTGFAHLFEHMMFQGSKNAPGEYFSFVERAGANLREGGVNGTTSNDRTNYFATVPSGNLEYLLWLESDRLATLPEVLSKETLDNQREVVRNERRQSLENQPYGRWFTLMTENLHPKDHPYSWPVIGSHEDLIAASLEDVREFFRRYYTPNNLTLTIAGDFEPAEAKRLVEKYFGELPPGPALDRPDHYIPKLDGQKIIEVRDRVPQERTYFAWPAPPYFDAEESSLDILSSVLTDGLSSRLNKALVYDRHIASDVSSFNFASEISGAFIIIATARPGASLDEIEKSVSEEIARIARTGPTTEEVERAKTKWEYQFVTGLEQIGGFGGKADRLAQYNTFLGDPARFDEDVARYRAVTPASIKAAAAKWIDNRNRLLIRFRPETSKRAAAAAPVNRAEQPKMGEDRRFVVPEVKKATLANGMEVHVVERRDLPKVAVTFATRAGSVHDPASKEGLAHLTVATIDMGTSTRKTLEIEDSLGNLGTELTGFAAREASNVSMQLLKRNLKPAMAIFADVVRNPQFPASEVDRERKRHLDALAQQANNPNAIAGRVRSMLQFGPNHPYGRPLQGLPSTVPAITRDDIASFHRANWKPASSTLIFAGDITIDEARSIAQEAFGDWSGGAAPIVSIPAAQPAGQPGRIYLVDRPGAAQTIVTQMLPGPARSADDYHAFRLVDAVWGGGGFGTRLNMNLRENKGYSYGVFSNMALYPTVGAWWAGGGVQTDKTAESLVEFVNELDALAGKKPISNAELTSAKETRVRGYAQQFETVDRIAQQIAELWSLRLPMSELQREPDATASVTDDALAAATRRYVSPQRSSLLLVGDREKIEQRVRDLKLGEIVILDVEGRPVTP
jgi:zinc protease